MGEQQKRERESVVERERPRVFLVVFRLSVVITIDHL